MQPIVDTDTTTNYSPDPKFESARLAYCEKLFEREAERKESLEKKAQFYLSLVTLILGGVFFKIDLIPAVAGAAVEEGASSVTVALVWMTAVVLGIGIFCALVAVLMAMKLQSYQNEHPADFITALFAPDSSFLPDQTEMGLQRALAESYAYAADTNKRVNDRKAAWIRKVSLALFVAIVALTCLLTAAIMIGS